MTRKLSIATLVLALFISASAMAPGDPPVQISQHPEGFFYSSGRSYLGVDVRDITSDRVSALKLKEERGVEITTVDQDAPAGKAGLKEHDVILEFNGARVESEEQFRRMIRETPPGRNIALGISRDGNPMTINVQIGDRGKIASNMFRIERPPMQLPEFPDFNIPFDIQVSGYTATLGVQVESLNQQLGEYFGVKGGEGLLVKSVEKGSPAEKAGMKAGDVIVRADNEKVTDRSDLRRLLRAHHDGGKMTIGIVREKREQNLTVDLPARKSRDSSGIEIVVPDADMADLESLDEIMPEVWEQVGPAIDGVLQQIEPEVDRTIDQTLTRVRPQLIKAQKALTTQFGPEFQKSMRRLQQQMQGLSKQLEKAQKNWHLESDNMI
ncbi:MAG TPA: PDZ domain-containing protein [Candidatus Angelobacter sp.]